MVLVVTLNREVTLDEAMAESTFEQTPSEIPSELDAIEAEEAFVFGPARRWEPTRSRLLAHFDLNEMEDWMRSSVSTFERGSKTFRPMLERGLDLRLDDGWLE